MNGIARLALVAPRRVLAVAVLVMAAIAIFGIPVVGSLSAGGMRDPDAESSRAAALLAGKFGQGDMDMIITVTSDDGAQGPRATAVGTELVERLKESANVGRVLSAWTVPPSGFHKPRMIFRIVDLPEPLAPRITFVCPGMSVKLTSFNATLSSKATARSFR